MEKNQITNKNYDYSKMNNMLGMLTMPYLGIYGQDYTFFSPIKCFYTKNPNNSLINSLPGKLQENIKNFRKNFNVETDYFDITLDGSFILYKFHRSNITHHLRVNTVLHPYLFYNIDNLTINREHKTSCFCALFTDQSQVDLNSNYISDTREVDGLRINPEWIITDENNKTVILHDSGDGFPALSPNNMAFLIDLKNCFFSFYLMTVSTYGNKVTKLLISRFTLLINTEIPILKNLNNVFNSMNNSNYLFEKVKENIILNSKSEIKNINQINLNDDYNSDNVIDIDKKNKNLHDKDINIIETNKKGISIEDKQTIKFNVKNLNDKNDITKIENFLTGLYYFENTFKVLINFMRGYIVNNIFETLQDIEIKNSMIKTNTFNDFIFNLISVCYENLYYDEYFETLNKNNSINIDENLYEHVNFQTIENINSIPIGYGKIFEHLNKINDYYPERNFVQKNKIENEDSNLKLLGEYGLYKFSEFVKILFKNPNIEKFGIKIFEDYLNIAKEKDNFFFCKFIDNFFIAELDKIINICNGYRFFFNEFGFDIPLTSRYNNSKFHSPLVDNVKLTNNEYKIYTTIHSNLMASLKKYKLLEKNLKTINENEQLSFEKYCDKNPLFNLVESLKTNSKFDEKFNGQIGVNEGIIDINKLELISLNQKDIQDLFQCPYKIIFIDLVNNFLNENLKEYEIICIVEKLSLNYQNYLFYKTWDKNGKVLGIHDDFGRHSFYKSKYIDPLYHIKNEDKVELVLEIISIIENLEE